MKISIEICVHLTNTWLFLLLIMKPYAAEMKRRISCSNHTTTPLKQLAAARGREVERELLEVEYSFIYDKLGKLQEKVCFLT